MNICLEPMTKELARTYFSRFQVDPALLPEGQEYQPYEFSAEKAEATVNRHYQLGRIYLAVMLNEEPIGEVILKNINNEQQHCTLGISLRSDDVKNKGYGTEAEIQALRYAFNVLNIDTVFADTVLNNTRSQHVLKKVGFKEIGQDNGFIYYRCDRSTWRPSQ